MAGQERKKLILLLLLTVLIIVLTSCGTTRTGGKEDTPEQAEEKILVVTSIFPLADIVQELGGERVEVVSLLSGGMSPHVYEPTTGDVRQVANADLVVLVGEGLDSFAEKLLEGHALIKVLHVTEGIRLQPPAMTILDINHEVNGEREHEEDSSEHHEHGSFDPHVWLDPVLVRENIAPRIAAQLIELDEHGKSYFENNLKRFQAELTSLDAEIKQVVDTFSYSKFIVFHSAWHYFALRYNLEDINVEDFPNQEPSAKDIMKIVKFGRETSAGAIFIEPQFNPKAAKVIAAEYDAEVIILDPLGNSEIDGRDSYLGLMHWNLEQLMKGLR